MNTSHQPPDGGSASRARALVISHEASSAQTVVCHLAPLGVQATVATSALAGDRLAQSQAFSLLVLDLDLPDFDGTAVCRRIRSAGMNTRAPLVALGASGREAEIVLALESGADAFLSKPIDTREFVAHVRALLEWWHRPTAAAQGSAPESPRPMRVRDVEIDVVRRHVTVRGVVASLTRQEFDLLTLLASHRGRVFSRRALATRIWDADADVSDRAVDIAVSRLRRQVELDPRRPSLIQTVRGQGYRFA